MCSVVLFAGSMDYNTMPASHALFYIPSSSPHGRASREGCLHPSLNLVGAVGLSARTILTKAQPYTMRVVLMEPCG